MNTKTSSMWCLLILAAHTTFSATFQKKGNECYGPYDAGEYQYIGDYIKLSDLLGTGAMWYFGYIPTNAYNITVTVTYYTEDGFYQANGAEVSVKNPASGKWDLKATILRKTSEGTSAAISISNTYLQPSNNNGLDFRIATKSYTHLYVHYVTVSYSQDTTAPGKPGLPDMNDEDDSGYSGTDNITSDTSPRFTWTQASDNSGGSGVKGYYWALDDSTPESGGTWTAETSAHPSDLSDSPYTIYVKAVDLVGNVGSASSRSFIIDTTPPGSFVLNSPISSIHVTRTSPYFDWSDSLDGGGGIADYEIHVQYDHVPYVNRIGPKHTGASSSYYDTPSDEALPAGGNGYDWEVRAWDKAGNCSDWIGYERFYVDDPVGTVRVDITPASAVSAGAQWRVDGYDSSSTWRDSGTTATGVPEGNYTIKFNSPSGWTGDNAKKPDDISVTIQEGSPQNKSGNYRRIISGYWSHPYPTYQYVYEYTSVDLFAEVEGFNQDDSFLFEIWEDDDNDIKQVVATVNGTVLYTGGKYIAKASWMAQWEEDGPVGSFGDPEYYFYVSRDGIFASSPNPTVFGGQDGELVVKPREPRGEITGFVNGTGDWQGTARTITVKVKNTGNDHANLIVEVDSASIPSGWSVTPGSKQTRVYYDSEDTSYFTFTVTPPANLASAGPITFKLKFDNWGAWNNTLLDTEGLAVSSNPKGNLDVTVKNQNGTAIAGATVSRYNSSWTPIDSKTTDGNGKASWSDVPIGIYNLEAYFNGEYWVNGSATVNNGATTSTTLQRNEPYAYDFKVFNGSTEVTGGTVAPNTPLTLRVYVRNNSLVSRTVRVQLWLDRDKASAFDFNQTNASQTVSANGGTATFTFSYTPTVEADFYRQLQVDTTVNSAWAKTDSWPWGLAVISTTGNKPAVANINIRDLDGQAVSGITPGKRYAITADFTDADGQDNLTYCIASLVNSADGREIALTYNPANGTMGIGSGGFPQLPMPLQDAYAFLTHVEKTPISNGYRIRFIFWLTAKWTACMDGVDIIGRAFDIPQHQTDLRLDANLDFTPQSLPAGKWTVIVHGRSSDSISIAGNNISWFPGPGKWGNSTTEWFDKQSRPDQTLSNWMWEMASKLGKVSKTEVVIHRLNRVGMGLQTWSGSSYATAYSPSSSGHNILLFDWEDPSDYVDIDDENFDDGYMYGTGDALYALLKKVGIEDKVTSFVGYSRGAIVVSEAVRRLRLQGLSGFHVLYLDGEGGGEFANEVRTSKFPFDVRDIGPSFLGSDDLKLQQALDETHILDNNPHPHVTAWQDGTATVDDAPELLQLRRISGFDDYRFYAWQGCRSDQYRQGYSNPDLVFCGAEAVAGANDRPVEWWPAYSSYNVGRETYGESGDVGQISHSHYPVYFTDWVYLETDSTLGGLACAVTPQLARWENPDSRGSYLTAGALLYGTESPVAGPYMEGSVFNGALQAGTLYYKDGSTDPCGGSVAGWTYHGGTTPFDTANEASIEKIEGDYWFQFSEGDLLNLYHNWQVAPALANGIRFNVDTWGWFLPDEAQIDIAWYGKRVPYNHILDFTADSVENVISITECTFTGNSDVGRLRFWGSGFNSSGIGSIYIDDVEFVENLTRPTVNTLSGTPNPVVQGLNLRLVAGGVAPGSGPIDHVRFYQDSNGNGQYDANTDQPFGPEVYSGSSGNWEITWTTAGIPVGQHYFFAYAYDSQGLMSAPVPLPPRINVTQPANQPPTIGGLSDSPDPVDRGANLTLTATNVADAGGTVARVEFYHDANNNGVFDEGAGALLGTDSSSVGGYTLTFNTGSLTMPAGSQTRRFFAVAFDNQGARSAEVYCRTTIIQKWNLAYQVAPEGFGTITSNPAAGRYADGTQIDPGASAAATYRFDHWEVNNVTKTMPVSLTADTTVKAVFEYNGPTVVPPILNAIGNQSVQVGQAFSLPVAKLQGDAPITWTLESAPSGMTIHHASGVVSWPNPTPAGSSHFVTVEATNGAGADVESFLLHVTGLGTVAQPQFSLDGGAYAESSLSVQITCETVGATIRYTTDGRPVTTNSPAIGNGGTVVITQPTQLRAAAFKMDWIESLPKEAVFSFFEPRVGILAPTNGQSLAGSKIPVMVVASDSDGVKQLSVFSGTNAVAATNLPAGTLSWSNNVVWANVSTGTHALTVQAMDVLNNINTSRVVSVIVLQAAAVPIVMEAEGFDNGGQGQAYNDTTAANLGGSYRIGEGVDIATDAGAGNGFVVGWTPAGEWMQYTVNVVASGTYTIEARVAAIGAGGQFRISVNGTDKTGLINVPNTGAWNAYLTVSKTGIELSSGIQTVRVVMVKAGPSGNVGAFDWFRMVPPVVRSAYPSGTPWALPGTVQAENFDNGGEGVACHDTTAANQGSAYRTAECVDIASDTGAGNGFVVGWTPAGEWLEYTVNVGQSGAYTLETRVAGVGVGGQFRILVNGADKTGSLNVPNTGAWNAYQTVSKTGVALSSGIQTVRVVMVTAGPSGNAGAFDWFRVGEAPPPPSQSAYPSGTPWTLPGTVEAENFDNGGQDVAYSDTSATNAGGQYRIGEGVDIARDTSAGNSHVVGWTSAGEWLEYTVNLSQSGTYTLDTRVAGVGAGGKFRIVVNGADKTGLLSVPDTAAWNAYQTVSKTGVALSSGIQTVRVEMVTVGPSGNVGAFDWFKISSSLPPTRGPYGGTRWAIPGYFAAKDFDVGGEGVAHHDNTPNNTGGVYRPNEGVDIASLAIRAMPAAVVAVGWTEPGEWLEYSVTVAVSGNYVAEVSGSSAGRGGTFQLQSDGVNIGGAMSFSDTGGWDSYGFSTPSQTFYLSAGNHIIRLSMLTPGQSGYVAALDMISIDPVSLGTQSLRANEVLAKSPNPVEVYTSHEKVQPGSGWLAADGDTNTIWQGVADMGGWWLALVYNPPVAVNGLTIDWAAESPTNVQFLHSLEEGALSELTLPLTNGPVDLNYLWLIIPNTGSNQTPAIREIHVE